MRASSAARPFVAWIPLAALLIVLLPAASAAQEPVKSFHQLNTRVSVGDTVWVTDAQGREIEGKITELHDESITLANGGPTTLQAGNVRVVQRRTKSVGKAALWGLLIGGIAGAAADAIDSSTGSCGDECYFGLGVALGAGIGAGVGAGVRAALPAGRKEVYRAPGASGSARLSLAPVITPRTKGVAVALTF